MIEIRVEAPDLPGIEQWPQRMQWAVSRLLAREAEEVARDFKTEMADQRIAATSLLINSVRADKIDEQTWSIGPHVAYASYVLDGRRPGGMMPPFQRIADWLKTKRGSSSPRAAWAVARAIQQRGIKGRDYLTPVAARAVARLETRAPAAIQTAMTGDVD